MAEVHVGSNFRLIRQIELIGQDANIVLKIADFSYCMAILCNKIILYWSGS